MKKILGSAILASLLFTSNLYAIDSKTEATSNKAVTEAKKTINKNSSVVKEAVNAIRYTEDALIYLHGKNIEKAKESIKKAIGELASVLNSPNPAYLLPVDISIEAYQFEGDIKKVKKLVNQAKDLLDDNKLPETRDILNVLRSEIVIKSVNLPLASYPSSLSLALKYLNENKIKESIDVLKLALSTLVETKTIIPIPLIKADYLISKAKQELKHNKKEALNYLKEASNQLKLAEILGYTSRSSTTYKNLKDSIAHLEREIKRGNETDSLFEKLIEKMHEFKEKAIHIVK